MKKIVYQLWVLVALLLWSIPLHAQNETECNPLEGLPVAQGEVLFNYGSVTNAFNFTNRSDNTIGQPLVGRGINQGFISEFGFWARFLVPPQPPAVLASQGDFPDRVQINWSTDDLSSKPTDGYIIKRDGAFLAAVDGLTTQFIDFNVQAGEFYEYSIQGRNQFGTGSPGSSIGFVNPNGVVTGKIETFSGNPVANAIVTLEPTVGKSLSFDGVQDYLCVSYDESLPTDMWTLGAWVQIGDGNDEGGIIDLGSDLNKNYWLHTTAAGSPKGIIAGVGDGTPHEIEVTFDEDPDDWHHVAMVYSGGKMIVYVDGMYRASMAAAMDTTAALFHIGSNRDQSSYFAGGIDDVRIYNKPLTQTDILLGKDITASSLTPGLVGYWKFDEGMGDRAFDISVNELHAAIEGATFSDDDAGVLNGGMTDVGGYYAIEGINYSEEQTFQAEAAKNFYQHTSIEFNGAFESYANLTTFDLPDTATIEISVQPFDVQSRQTLLSQGTAFELFIENGFFQLTLNGNTQTLGPATNDFQHIALLMNGGTNEVAYYNNGSLVSTLTGYTIGADYGTAPWQLAANGGNTPMDFYTGLIDEVAFFDTLVNLPTLQIHASPLTGDGIESGIDGGDGNLLVWFPLDEGEGTEIDDYGPMLTGTGEITEATFSIVAYRQATTPHVFRPSERVVNINPSATAIGNIDFVDESTVTISGVVRFSNTFCYQDSVQLLVNGVPNFPPIYTNSEGRFVGDFEPGSNIMLTPIFPDSTHIFSPTFFEVRRI
ncbi:MAG: LamG-like jellyroll fold domain-containing protein, partial [Bacteroidota bacterium]